MREHHTLGCSGGAGGVDQRRQVVAIPFDRSHRIEFAGLIERDHFDTVIVDRHGLRMHRDDALDLRQFAKAAHLSDQRIAVTSNQPRAGILDYVTGLFRTTGGIERYYYCAESEHRLIENHPMRSIFREDRDAIARLDPDARQSTAQPFDAIVKAGPRM